MMGQAAIVSGSNARSSNRIFVLSKHAFWIIVIIASVVIAGAVGGGVGDALAGKKSTSQTVVSPTGNVASQSSSSSTTPSSTSTPSTSQIPATTTVTIAVATATDMASCPLVNNTIFTAPSTSTFLCYFDVLGTGNLAGIDEKEYSGVTTFDSCIGLCDSMNTVSGSKVCKAVVWDLEGSNYRDYWLKNSTQTLTSNIATGNPNGTVCAILQ